MEQFQSLFQFSAEYILVVKLGISLFSTIFTHYIHYGRILIIIPSFSWIYFGGETWDITIFHHFYQLYSLCDNFSYYSKFQLNIFWWWNLGYHYFLPFLPTIFMCIKCRKVNKLWFLVSFHIISVFQHDWSCRNTCFLTQWCWKMS